MGGEDGTLNTPRRKIAARSVIEAQFYAARVLAQMRQHDEYRKIKTHQSKTKVAYVFLLYLHILMFEEIKR